MIRTIIIWAIVLFIMSLWFSTVIKSCTAKKPSDSGIADIESSVDENLLPGNEDEISDADLESLANGELESEDPGYSAEDSQPNQAIEKMELDDNSGKAPSSESSYGTRNAERYMVVAGTFESREYAQSELERLKKLGYQDAELVRFDFSRYHTICVGRYDNINEANTTVASLKKDGINSYVHRRRGKTL